jgi:hypothetical protein
VPVAEEATCVCWPMSLRSTARPLATSPPRCKRRYAIASDGRRFLTSAPFLAEPATTAATKDQWWRGMDEGSHRITMPNRPLRR